jgi:fibronectin-binding autotransporter adhesin
MKTTTKTLFALSAATLICSSASAITFDNGGVGADGTWETADNWDGNTLPGTTEQPGFSADATLQSEQTIGRLLLSGAGDLTIKDEGILNSTSSIGLIYNGRTLTIEDGGSYIRSGALDLRNSGNAGVISVEDGGSFSLGALRAANGGLVVSGSTADVTIHDITTVDPNLNSGNNSNFTANASTITLNGATLNVTGTMQWDGASALSIGAGSTLNLSGAAATHILSDGLEIVGGGLVKLAGTLDANTPTINITGAGSTFQLGTGGTGGAIDASSVITLASGGTFAVNQSDTVTQSSDLSGLALTGDGKFEQNGSGTTILDVANTHTGGTTLNAGTLNLNAVGAAGSGTLTLSGGTLNSIGSSTQTNNIVVTGGTSTAVFSTTTGENKYNGNISGSGTLNFGGTGSGQGTGTVRIYNLDNFTGTINHAAGSGYLFIEPGPQTETTTAKISTSGATNGAAIRFRGHWTIGELSGTGGKIISWDGSSLTVNQSTDTIYSGLLADNDPARTLILTKDGSGTLTLDFTNTYTGLTTVSGGQLIINGNQTAATGATTVEAGAAIGGDGTLGSTLDLAAGAKFVFSVDDSLTSIGLVTLHDSFGINSLVAADGSSIVWSTIDLGIYTLIDGAGATDFSNIANFGAANKADIGDGMFAYFQNGSLQLVVVPEPSAYALIGGLLALGYVMVRRRR